MSYLLFVRLDLSYGCVRVLCMCGLAGKHGCTVKNSGETC